MYIYTKNSAKDIIHNQLKLTEGSIDLRCTADWADEFTAGKVYTFTKSNTSKTFHTDGNTTDGCAGSHTTFELVTPMPEETPVVPTVLILLNNEILAKREELKQLEQAKAILEEI
jgi:hypothetical protein